MLVLVTLMWGFLFLINIGDYTLYVSKFHYPIMRIPSLDRTYIDPIPELYWNWGNGGVMLATGIMLLGLWIIFFSTMKMLKLSFISSSRDLIIFLRTHLFELILLVALSIIALVTFYCDYVVLKFLDFNPTYLHKIFFEGIKPKYLSFLPPQGLYPFTTSITYKPLSLLDLFSLFFPIFYLVFLIIEIFRYHRWKIKISINEETIQINKKTATL